MRHPKKVPKHPVRGRRPAPLRSEREAAEFFATNQLRFDKERGPYQRASRQMLTRG